MVGVPFDPLPCRLVCKIISVSLEWTIQFKRYSKSQKRCGTHTNLFSSTYKCCLSGKLALMYTTVRSGDLQRENIWFAVSPMFLYLNSTIYLTKVIFYTQRQIECTTSLTGYMQVPSRRKPGNHELVWPNIFTRLCIFSPHLCYADAFTQSLHTCSRTKSIYTLRKHCVFCAVFGPISATKHQRLLQSAPTASIFAYRGFNLQHYLDRKSVKNAFF